MFKYFILRTQQQLFCYFCGIVLAMVLCSCSLLFCGGVGFICFYRSVVLFWAGLVLIPVTSTG
jgi:hypothetical protein